MVAVAKAGIEASRIREADTEKMMPTVGFAMRPV
jgi:hypothetical protein